ncbi:MAG: AEC family transporter [Gammaproteobacteria bacterium]
MILNVLGIVFPIFAIVLAGFLYTRHHVPDMAAANRLNMDIFLPALLFVVVADDSFKPGDFGLLALAGLAVVLGSGLIALPVARLFGYQNLTFNPPMMFNNCGNMGLPLALLAFGEKELAGAIVLFLVSNTLHFSLGNWLLSGRTKLSSLFKNPILVATAVAFVVNLANIPVPEMLWRSIDMLGQISIPLMLFSLGVRMTGVDMTDWKIGMVGAIMSPLTGLIIAIPVGLALGIEGVDWAQLIIFAALPPAVLNFMFAEKYGQEPRKVAAIVLMGNMVAILVIPATLLVVL